MSTVGKDAKAAGTRREHSVKRLLEHAGWVVMRAPASIGEADLIALKRGERPRFVQVKANLGSPYMNFRRAERAALGLWPSCAIGRRMVSSVGLTRRSGHESL